jgi:geranylgeranyl diphosphate synthase, type I
MTAGVDRELARLGELVDGWMRQAVAAHVSAHAERLGAMLDYHLGWRDLDLRPLDRPANAGKRLRPALTLLVSEAVCGEITPLARNAAVAVELVHNFSLVHDDIQDRSELRRHRQTVWSRWGMPQAINVGDALFALALLSVVQDGSSTAAELAAQLNLAALQLAEGQFLDIELQAGGTPATLEAYESMIARKTGALFACAARLGAMAAGAPADRCNAYAAFGLELGIAFQEQDDVLGVWGRSAETGKPDAADVIERKRGLPASIALSRADAPDWLRSAFAQNEHAPDAATVERIVAHFDRLELRTAVERRVERRYRAALDWLESAAPRAPAAGYLAAICEGLVSRRA